MADPALSPTLARILREYERRLAAVERSASMPWSSLRGGAMRFQDTSGDDRFVLGNLELDPLTGDVEFDEGVSYGVMLFGGGGALLLWSHEGSLGLMYPTQEITFHPFHSTAESSGPFHAHQNTTFTTGYSFQTYAPTGDTVVVDMNVQTPDDTTAEVRLAEGFSLSATSPVAIPTGFNGTVRFRWIHPSSTGLYDGRGRNPNCALNVESRIVTGPGFVSVLQPHRASIATSALWSTTAHPASEDGAGRILTDL